MLLAVACSIALGPMVTFETRGMVVSKLLPELSRIVSAKLESRGLEDVALSVSLRNQPFEKVKGWLAEACDAEWSQEKDRLVLVRSAGRRQIAARTEALWRGQQFKRWIEKNLPDQAWSDSQIEEVIAANAKKADEEVTLYVESAKPTNPIFLQWDRAKTPAHVLLGRLLRSVSAEYLGAFPVNCQVITTTQPNPYEKPIPVKTDALTADWMSLARRYASRMDSAPRQNGAVTHRTQEAWLQAYRGQTPQLFVVYSRPHATAALSVRLYVWDGSRVLDTANVEMQLEPTVPRPRETPAPTWDLKVSELTQLILARAKQRSQARIRVMAEPGVEAEMPVGFNTFAPPPLDAAVRRPTVVEPHSIGTADAVLGIARTRKKDFIAHVPDSAIYGITNALGAGGLNAIWENPMNFAMTIEEGEILLIRPNFFARADRYRVRRAALEKWLNTFGPSSLPSLEDHLAYVKLAPESDFSNNLDHFYSILLDPSQTGLDLSSRDFKKLLGELGGEKVGESQTIVPVGQLSSAQIRRCIEHLAAAFLTERFYSVGSRFDEPIWEPPTRKTFDSVVLQRQTVPTLLVSNGAQYGLLSPLGLGIRDGANPDRVIGFDLKTKFDQFCLADEGVATIRFATGAGWQGVYGEFNTVRSNQFLNGDQLPPNILKEIERGRAKGHLVSASVGTNGPTRTPPP